MISKAQKKSFSANRPVKCCIHVTFNTEFCKRCIMLFIFSMIVLELPKTRKDGFLQRIKQFVSWLYNVVRKRIKPCVFSALTKSSDGVIFRVLVILTEEKDLDKFIEKWEEEKFQTEKSQTSSTVMVKPNDTFLLRLEGAQLKIQGERMFRISFQSERLTKHEFLVVSKEFEFGRLLIYKLKADKVVELRKIQR